MKRIIHSRISRKFLTLALLSCALFFAATTDFFTQTVKADECCDNCNNALFECLENCANDPNSPPMCSNTCYIVYNSCSRYCGRCE